MSIYTQRRFYSSKKWYVTKIVHTSTFYVIDVDRDTNYVTWAATSTNAIKFRSRSGGIKFIKSFLSTRRDLKLISLFDVS